MKAVFCECYDRISIGNKKIKCFQSLTGNFFIASFAISTDGKSQYAILPLSYRIRYGVPVLSNILENSNILEISDAAPANTYTHWLVLLMIFIPFFIEWFESYPC